MRHSAAGIESILAVGQDFGLDSFDSSAGGLHESYQQFFDAFHKTNTGFDVQKLYVADRLLQKIIGIPVFDALANWREITNTRLAEYDQAFDFVELCQDASEKARLNDLSCIYPVLRFKDTGRMPASKTPLSRIVRPVEVSALVVHPKVMAGDELDENIHSPNFGKPIFYKCGDVEIHHSRLILFGADEPSFMQSIAGYLRDFHGVAARLYEAIRRNQSFIYKADFAEAVKYLQAQMKTGQQHQKSQLEIIAETKAKSAKANLAENNVLIIGQNENIDQQSAQNIDDLVKAFEQQMTLLSGVSGITASQLFSIFPSGLNTGNFQNTEVYSQALDRYRSQSIDKPLRRLDRFFATIYSFDYTPDSWQWNDTKAEELLVRLRATQTTESLNAN